MDYNSKALELHKNYRGKLNINSVAPIDTMETLATVYSPGVAAPCLEIAKDNSKVYDYTIKGRTIGIISDGSAVLGLGDIGAEASLPVMEGKAALITEFAGLNAFPIVLKTQDVNEIIDIITKISPVFGGINLEDISAPRCFEIEERLQNLGIPVFHDDQHGTAIVVLAGLINAMIALGRDLKNQKIVINGAGAAGIAITKLLISYGVGEVIICDSKGIVATSRTDLNPIKQQIVNITNPKHIVGDLLVALKEADIFIGVSKADLLKEEHFEVMNPDPVIFALANPNPEIIPPEAYKLGASIVATGRSDYPNQINNVLAFPGIFKGLMQRNIKQVTINHKLDAAKALAGHIKNPSKLNLLPKALDKDVVEIIANSII